MAMTLLLEVNQLNFSGLGRGIFETIIVFAETRARASKAGMYVYMANARREASIHSFNLRMLLYKKENSVY